MTHFEELRVLNLAIHRDLFARECIEKDGSWYEIERIDCTNWYFPIRNYSSDIKLVWQVVEEMSRRGYFLILGCCAANCGAYAEFFLEGCGRSMSRSHTAPEAICSAAIKALAAARMLAVGVH